MFIFRPAANASRAGTAGFRPPEVLLRYPAQTTGNYCVHCDGIYLKSNVLDRTKFRCCASIVWSNCFAELSSQAQIVS